jgi:type II secretory pathway pseudopilin PulG
MPIGEPACGPDSARRSAGFTYLWLLFVIALGGVALAALGQQQQTIQQREREAELRFRGEAIAAAILSYVEQSPDGNKALPTRLEDLLEDRRHLPACRHLRRLYTDPFTGRADWVLLQGHLPQPVPADAIAVDPDAGAMSSTNNSSVVQLAGVIGVSSRSQAALMATGAAQTGAGASAGARIPRVADLQFVAAGLSNSTEMQTVVPEPIGSFN